MMTSHSKIMRYVGESLRGCKDIGRVLTSLADEDEVSGELGGCEFDLIVGSKVSKSSRRG